MNIKEKRERRAKLIADARTLLDEAHASNDESRVAEVEARFDEMMDEAARLQRDIERDERLTDAERSLDREAVDPESRALPGGALAAGSDGDPRAQYRAAFDTYLRYGRDGLLPDQVQVLQRGYATAEVGAVLGDQRAQSTSGSAGGYTIPTDTATEVFRAMAEFDGVPAVARTLNTGTGNSMQWPTVDDTANKATLVSEAGTSTDTDVTFAQKQLDAYMFRTMVTASLELLQDTTIDLVGLINAIFAERLFLGLNEYLTTGTGSSQPNGVVTASAAGATALGETSIDTDDLMNLQFSLKRQYRRNGTWMMNDTTVKVVSKLKDSDGRFLWQAGLTAGQPDTLLGRPLNINDDMAEVAGANKSILFGDFSQYLLRNVANPMIVRLNERFMEKGQVAFILFSRHDGELMAANATTYNPIKHLVHPS